MWAMAKPGAAARGRPWPRVTTVHVNSLTAWSKSEMASGWHPVRALAVLFMALLRADCPGCRAPSSAIEPGRPKDLVDRERIDVIDPGFSGCAERARAAQW
jgi:hypothetical protein